MKYASHSPHHIHKAKNLSKYNLSIMVGITLSPNSSTVNIHLLLIHSKKKKSYSICN